MRLAAALILHFILAGCSKKEFEIPAVVKLQSVKLVFAGDVMFDRGIRRILSNGVRPLDRIAGLIQEADIAVCNLETSVCQTGIRQNKRFTFCSPLEALKQISSAGFDAVSLGNNHVMDFGEQGLIETLSNLKQTEILYCGAGTNLRTAEDALIIIKGVMRFALLSFGDVFPTNLYAHSNSAGIAGIHESNISNSLAALKGQCDFKIVMLHWGVEYENFIRDWQRSFARRIIDYGADAVICHGPHVLQGFEIYKNKPIAASLGNFLFDQRWNENVLTTALFTIEIEPLQNITNINYYVTPMKRDSNDFGPPGFLSNEESMQFVPMLQKLQGGLEGILVYKNNGRFLLKSK